MMKQLLIVKFIRVGIVLAKELRASVHNELDSVIKNSHDKDSFEEYSYYVGTEITCGRMPKKYGPWLSSR